MTARVLGSGLIALAVALALLVLVLALPSLASAQPAPPGQASGVVVGDTVELRLDREVFRYPQFGRADPFRPLLGDNAGPRFEDMVLLGVILSSGEGESVALMGVRQGGALRADSVMVEVGEEFESPPPVELARPTRSRTQRLRVGDRWGNVRIVLIERNRVLVDVTEFGLTDRRELFLRRPAQGEN